MQPDVTLNLDVSGIIQRVALSNSIAHESVEAWVGKAWIDTVVAAPAVQRMLDDAQKAGVSAFHWVNQRFPSGLELPIEYTTVLLGGGAGMIAIGRSLEAVEGLGADLAAAKVSMERDAWKMRSVETRRRLLFNSATQPSLMIRPSDLVITEANPAATEALKASVGDALLLPFDEQTALKATLIIATTHGTAPAITLHLGSERAPWLVRASLPTESPAEGVLLRLSRTIAPIARVNADGPTREEARKLIQEKVAAIEAQVAQTVSELKRGTRES